ncbi:MAG: hypothetical protein U0R78_15420 [Nocardioidaceae bacterium]
MVEGDHDGGGGLAVEVVGGEVVEELDEPLLPTLRPVDAVAGRPGLGLRCAEPAAAW